MGETPFGDASTFLGLVLLALGGGVLIVAAISLRATGRLARDIPSWPMAPAVVVGSDRVTRQVKNAQGFTRTATVAWRTEVRYRDHTGQDRRSWAGGDVRVPWSPGDPVQVRYDPANPLRVVIGDGGNSATPSQGIAFLLMGGIFLLMGVLALTGAMGI